LTVDNEAVISLHFFYRLPVAVVFITPSLAASLLSAFAIITSFSLLPVSQLQEMPIEPGFLSQLQRIDATPDSNAPSRRGAIIFVAGDASYAKYHCPS